MTTSTTKVRNCMCTFKDCRSICLKAEVSSNPKISEGCKLLRIRSNNLRRNCIIAFPSLRGKHAASSSLYFAKWHFHPNTWADDKYESGVLEIVSFNPDKESSDKYRYQKGEKVTKGRPKKGTVVEYVNAPTQTILEWHSYLRQCENDAREMAQALHNLAIMPSDIRKTVETFCEIQTSDLARRISVLENEVRDMGMGTRFREVKRREDRSFAVNFGDLEYWLKRSRIAPPFSEDEAPINENEDDEWLPGSDGDSDNDQDSIDHDESQDNEENDAEGDFLPSSTSAATHTASNTQRSKKKAKLSASDGTFPYGGYHFVSEP